MKGSDHDMSAKPFNYLPLFLLLSGYTIVPIYHGEWFVIVAGNMVNQTNHRCHCI